MKKTILFVLLVFTFQLSFLNSASAQEKYYDEQANGMEQIDQAIVEARESGRYVLCQVGGNWCPWCIRFANFAYNDTAVAPLIKEEFVYIHVNYSKDNKNPEAMEFLGNPARFGFPVFVIINDEGRPIHIQESASLEEGKSYDRKKVKNFLSLWTKKAVTTLK